MPKKTIENTTDSRRKDIVLSLSGQKQIEIGDVVTDAIGAALEPILKRYCLLGKTGDWQKMIIEKNIVGARLSYKIILKRRE